MLAFFQFIFSSFWIFLGFVLLFSGVINGIARIIHSFIPDKHYHIDGYRLDDDRLNKFIQYMQQKERQEKTVSWDNGWQ